MKKKGKVTSRADMVERYDNPKSSNTGSVRGIKGIADDTADALQKIKYDQDAWERNIGDMIPWDEPEATPEATT